MPGNRSLHFGSFTSVVFYAVGKFGEGSEGRGEGEGKGGGFIFAGESADDCLVARPEVGTAEPRGRDAAIGLGGVD